MNPRYGAVARRASFRCEFCHAPQAVFNLPLEVEHIIPPNKGGSQELDNLALACRSCNLFKSDHTFVAELESQIPLFHPRKDVWQEHFQVLPSDELAPLTDAARVTIAPLQLNAAHQIAARRLWKKLGLFP